METNSLRDMFPVEAPTSEFVEWEECKTPRCQGSSGVVFQLKNGRWKPSTILSCDKCNN